MLVSYRASRNLIEVLAEATPQSTLQLYIFIRQFHANSHFNVPLPLLVQSLSLSLLSLVDAKWRQQLSAHPAPGIFESVCVGRTAADELHQGGLPHRSVPRDQHAQGAAGAARLGVLRSHGIIRSTLDNVFIETPQ